MLLGKSNCLKWSHVFQAYALPYSAMFHTSLEFIENKFLNFLTFLHVICVIFAAGTAPSADGLDENGNPVEVMSVAVEIQLPSVTGL